MLTPSEFNRLTAIAARNGAGDDAPDIAQSAMVWYLGLPRPLTEQQTCNQFNVLARRVQTQALNFRKRHARTVAFTGDIRVTYAARRTVQSSIGTILAKLSADDRALLVAERGTVTPSQRVKRARLISKIRAMI